MNYLNLTIEELHQAIIDGKVTPKQLVEESLKLAKENNDNAFEYICEKEAIEAVNALDSTKINNIFYGIPIVIKDNFSTKDISTTGSSNILNGYVPIYSATVVQKLVDQGAIIIGKTTLDELAMGGSGTTGHKGTTFNPWDAKHERLIGGSSCGSAVATCAGIVPFALGSDTGDSVRKPASNAGLVGLKPTWGRISRYGLFPFATSLDHVAYFTRSVKDSALALNVLAGRDNKDSSSSYVEIEDYTKNLDNTIKGKKIAVINQVINSITNKEIINSFNKSISYLKETGATIDYVDMDEKLLEAIYPTYIVISCAEATSNNANLDGIKFGARCQGESYEDVIKETRTKGFSELIKRRFVIGSYSLLKENQKDLFVKAQKVRRLIVNAFNVLFEKYDAIYCPASPSVAPLINGHSGDKLSNEYLIADNYLAYGNMGGFPSITLPVGIIDGLPIGANLTCKPFAESTLFNISYYIEKGTGLKNIIAKEDK